jgi:two-component system, sensor histidine kinase and response regulator
MSNAFSSPGENCDLSGEVFNLAGALECVEGDRELLAEMIGLFLAECPDLLAEIRSALAAQDATTLQHAAHTLKGSVGNFSARRAFAAALTLEKLGRAGDLAAAPAAFAVLEQELAHLQPILASVTPDGVA